MRMDLAGERFQVEEGYQVELPPGDHLIVVAGAHLGKPAYDFDHPNIAAKKSELFEFKHYRKGGSKFWTSKAGISFYFVIPKAQIELLPEKGYSYVPGAHPRPQVPTERQRRRPATAAGPTTCGRWPTSVAAGRSRPSGRWRRLPSTPTSVVPRGSLWKSRRSRTTSKRGLSRRQPPSRCGPGWGRGARCFLCDRLGLHGQPGAVCR